MILSEKTGSSKLMRSMIFIILIFIAYTNSGFAENTNQTRVRSFLSSQNEVRIWISNSYRYGHYSHTLSVMDELRRIGFSGLFRVIYANHMKTYEHEFMQVWKDHLDKLKTLFPKFDSSKEIQVIEPGLVLESIIHFQKNHHPNIDLSISGGIDGNYVNLHSLLQSEFSLVLNPHGWEFPSHFATNRTLFFRKKLLNKIHLMHTPINTVKTKHLDQFVSNQYGEQKPFIKPLTYLLESSDIQNLGFMPWYGSDRDFDIPLFLKYLSDTQTQLHRQFHKGIVIPVLDHSLNMTMDSFGEARVETIKLTDRLLQQKIQQLKPGNILLVHVGEVPKNIFEEFYKRANLPPVISGKNSKSICDQIGIPYISAIDLNLERSRYNPQGFFTSNYGRQLIHVAHVNHPDFFYKYLTGQKIMDSFWSNFLDPNSSLMKDAKKRAKNLKKPRYNKVYQAILQTIPIIDAGKSCQMSFIQRVKSLPYLRNL